MGSRITLLLAAVALAAAGWLDLGLADRLLARPYDVVSVPSGAAARVTALGHRTLLSDLYWLSLVQYVGDSKADERGWDKLFPLADLVTDLDPRHGYAYQTAGIVLSAVGQLDASDRILEKGVRQGPPYWSFPFYLSFNHWFYRGDLEKGAHWARVAARVPGASPNISQLAVSLSAKSGAPEEAIALLRELRATVQDEVTASRLDDSLRLAILERDAQALERAVARFREAQGRDPLALEELVVAGLVASIPEDPFGGAYRWDADERKVRSTANPFRFEIRDGPQPAGWVKPKTEPRRKPE